MRQFSRLFWLMTLCILSYSATAQKWDKIYADTNCFAIHTTTVAGKKYIGFINADSYILLNARADTLIKKADYYVDAGFQDFNKDGYQDILLYYSSNTPLAFDLFLFAPNMGKFIEVKNFREFPAPEPIKKTKYYYSYHKSGCADMNWDSDLFYIENFKAIRIGNIAGRQCNNTGVRDAIYIYKVHRRQEKLFMTLPIGTIKTYKVFKWGFIRDYWTRKYRLFL